MDKKEMGKVIKDLRKEKGLTQRELAAACNVHFSNLAQIELGKLNPTIDTLLRVVDGCGGEIVITRR